MKSRKTIAGSSMMEMAHSSVVSVFALAALVAAGTGNGLQ
jgi:hypothetical protein